MEKKLSIKKINVYNKTLYVKVEWSEENEYNLFNVKVFDGAHTWSGRYSKEFAERYRERVDESYEEYIKSVKDSLSRNSDMYVYDFSSVPGDTMSSTFSWKKKYEGQSAILVHGSVLMHKDDLTESKDILIDYLLSENKMLRHGIDDYTMKNNTLTADLAKYQTELKKFVDLKSSIEISMYGKFVQLLNAKKSRIQILEENLKKYEEPYIVDTEVD